MSAARSPGSARDSLTSSSPIGSSIGSPGAIDSPSPAPRGEASSMARKSKTMKLRKVLGSEADESKVVDPGVVLYTQILRTGYHIPPQYESSPIDMDDTNVIELLEAHKALPKLPDISIHQAPSSPPPPAPLGMGRASSIDELTVGLGTGPASPGIGSPPAIPEVDEKWTGLFTRKIKSKDVLQTLAASSIASGGVPGSQSNSPAVLAQRTHLFVGIKDFQIPASIKSAGSFLEIYFCIYDSAKQVALTEEFMFTFDSTSTGFEAGAKCIFRNCDQSVMLQNTFLICRVYKQAPLKSEDGSAGMFKLIGTVKGKGKATMVRRPVGTCVFDLSGSSDSLGLLQPLASGPVPLYQAANEKHFSELHKLIIDGSDKSQPIEGMFLNMALQLHSESIAELIKKYDEASTAVVNFTDIGRAVSEPGERKHLLYVTLLSGEFSQGKKKTAKNVQVSLRLCDEKGDAQDYAVARGIAGGGAVWGHEYQSSVLYHSNNPSFNETVIVKLPSPEQLAQYHLYFEFRHCSSSADKDEAAGPFSFAFLPLVPQSAGPIATLDTLIEDRVYIRQCYKYKYKHRPKLQANGSYRHTFATTYEEDLVEASVTASPVITGGTLGRLRGKSTAIGKLSKEASLSVIPKDDKEVSRSSAPSSAGEEILTFGTYFLRSSDDFFTVSTQLCSNRISNDRSFQALINWKSVEVDEVLSSIRSIQNCELSVKACFSNVLFESFLEIISKDFGDALKLIDISFFTLSKIIQEFSNGGEYSKKVLSYIINSSPGAGKVHFPILKLLKTAILEEEDSDKLAVFVGSLRYLIEISLNSYRNDKTADAEKFKTAIQEVFESLTKLVTGKREKDSKNWLTMTSTIGHSLEAAAFLQSFDVLYLVHTMFSERELFNLFHDIFEFVSTSSQSSSIQKLKHFSSLFTHSIMTLTTFASLVLRDVENHVRTYIMKGFNDQFVTVLLLYRLALYFLKSAKLDSAASIISDGFPAHFRKFLGPIVDTIFKVLYSSGNKDVAVAASPNEISASDRVPGSEKKTSAPESLSAKSLGMTSLDGRSADIGAGGLKSLSGLVDTEEASKEAIATLLHLLVSAGDEDLDTALLLPRLETGSRFVSPKAPIEEEKSFEVEEPSSPRKSLSGSGVGRKSLFDASASVFEPKESQIRSIERLLDIFYQITHKSVLSDGDVWLLLRAHELKVGLRVIEWITDSVAELVNRFSSVPSPTLKSVSFSGIWRKIWKLTMGMLESQTFNGKAAPRLEEIFRIDLREKVVASALELWPKTPPEGRKNLGELLIPAVTRLLLRPDTFDFEEIQQLCEVILVELLSQEVTEHGSPLSFETYCIDTIDTFLSGGAGASLLSRPAREERINEFLEFLKQVLKKPSTDVVRSSFSELVSAVEEQVRELLALQHEGDAEGGIDGRIDAILRMMELMEQKGRKEMWERYLMALIDSLSETKNNVEKAQALQLYNSHLTFSSQILPSLRSFPKETMTDRKIRVLKEVTALFVSSKFWEKSLDALRELSYAYEKHTMEYGKAAQCLRTMAQTLDTIPQDERIFPTYYRVALYGEGFSERLQNKSFVYRSGREGGAPETVMEFTSRIKSYFPRAKVINSAEALSVEMLGPMIASAAAGGTDSPSAQQLVQITTLLPSSEDELIEMTTGIRSEEREKLETSVPTQIRLYRTFNDVTVFKFSRVSKKIKDKDKKEKDKDKKNEFSDLWVTHVFVTTKAKMPSVRRRELIEKVVEVETTPLQNAALSIRDKTKDLKRVISVTKEQALTTGNPDIGPLSLILNGIIDAAVMGGVKKYQEAFFESDYLELNPLDLKYVEVFQEAMREQMGSLRKALELFDRHCTPKLRPLYSHLAEMYETMLQQHKNLIG